MTKRAKKEKRPTAKIDFKPYGAAIKAGRTKQKESRNKAADALFISPRYLANIENDGTIPSLPVIIQLIRNCGLPVERYFNPEVLRSESEQRQRVGHKLKLCPEEYLPIIEGAIDGAMNGEMLFRPLS